MDSLLCLDTSGSMAGSSLQELKRAVLTFIQFAEQVDIGGYIGIAEFGHRTGVQVQMTRNFGQLKRTVNSLTASGGTPMAEGLVAGLQELVTRGRILSVGSVTLMPRVILMTDGAPDSKEKVLAVAKACAETGFPIACVGVSGCDSHLLQTIAKATGGMFTYASEITELSVFFLKQILLTIYIAKFAEQIEQLYSREVLRDFMHQQTGQYLSEDELDMFILYLKALAVVKEQSSNTSYQNQTQYVPPRVTGPRYQPDDADATWATMCFLFGFCLPLLWCFNLKYWSSGNSTARCCSKLSLCMFFIAIIAIVVPVSIILTRN